MIRFHRNGIMVITDASGRAYIFDSKEALSDVARFIWTEEHLQEYRIEGPTAPKGAKEVIFVELGKAKFQRLRDLSSTPDQHFSEQF